MSWLGKRFRHCKATAHKSQSNTEKAPIRTQRSVPSPEKEIILSEWERGMIAIRKMEPP